MSDEVVLSPGAMGDVDAEEIKEVPFKVVLGFGVSEGVISTCDDEGPSDCVLGELVEVGSAGGLPEGASDDIGDVVDVGGGCAFVEGSLVEGLSPTPLVWVGGLSVVDASVFASPVPNTSPRILDSKPD